MGREVSALVALATAVVVASVSSCSESSGRALPTANHPSSQATTATGTPKTQANPFTGFKACELLDKAMAGMGFPPSEVSIAGSNNGCQTSKPQVATYALYLQPSYPLGKFGDNPSKLHDGQINGRNAVLRRENGGSDGACDIAMAVPPADTAIVGLQYNGSTDKACDLVKQLAKKIEPMLPGGK